MEGWFDGGYLPSSLANLKYLRKLDLGANHLTGTLPPELGSLEHIENLEFDNNNFHGAIPEAWAGLRLLRRNTSDHHPREGAPNGGCGVFVGFNTHPSGKFGFECPYPDFLLTSTVTSTVNSTVATSWGLKRECGLNAEDQTPDEEWPKGQRPGAKQLHEDGEPVQDPAKSKSELAAHLQLLNDKQHPIIKKLQSVAKLIKSGTHPKTGKKLDEGQLKKLREKLVALKLELSEQLNNKKLRTEL
jgi:hypothetical protein